MKEQKTYLVTGGAGFIGSNFILYMLEKYGEAIRIVNVDALTYAGNPEKIYLDFFNDLSQADYLVAHHAPFDKRFIAKDARRRLKGIASSVAIEINYVIRTIDTIDTKKDFIFLNPIWKESRHPGPYLDEMCRFLSVPVHKMQFHNADGDVEAMRLCMLRIKELYPDTIPC